MYHPLTPGQSWVQSPVSFRRESGGRGVREGEGERNEHGRRYGQILSGDVKRKII